MFELTCIAQRRIEITHYGNHSLGLAGALLSILNLEQRVYHFVDVSSILGKIEFTAGEIIIFSHCCRVKNQELDNRNIARRSYYRSRQTKQATDVVRYVQKPHLYKIFWSIERQCPIVGV